MKLYVWYGVLTDYTSGVIFAMASSVESARKKAIASGDCPGTCEAIANAVEAEPVVLSGKDAAGYCYGGG